MNELAQSILNPARRRPIAVVTTTFGGDVPYVDVAELAAAVSDVADIAVVSSGDLTFELAAALPNNCETFNGAVRSFPVGDEWRERPSLARRRFSFSKNEQQKVLDAVVDDLIGMAHRAGLSVASAADARPASGVVARMLADDSRAIVQLDGGGLATISAEVTFAPAPLRWVVREGTRVTGQLDPETRRLALDPAIPDASALWSRYPDGSVTLALVHTVERQRATLLVHPQHPVSVTRADLSPNPLDRVDLLLTEGDVIEVRVVRGPQGRRALRTIDLDDDEPVLPAVALTPGGEPWLEIGRSLLEPEPELTVTSIEQFLSTVGITRAPEIDEPEAVEAVAVEAPAVEAPTAPRPGPGSRPAAAPATPAPSPDTATSKRTALQSALATIDELQAKLRAARSARTGPSTDALRVEVEQLKGLAATLVAEKQRAFDEARALRDRLKDAQASLRAARRTAADVAPATARDRRGRFADAEQWIRHELYLQWVDRLDASTRAQHPLTDALVIGPRFADSLAGLDDTQLDKALRCAMEAASGFITKVGAREVHALRSGDGASDAPVQRSSDGARCMRAYVEQNTPQARRLHYWVLRGGGVELSRVVLHDDVEA
ncbi:MAG: hypothetical protein B7Y93_07020 [Micrococcales bacterium 32-70-13]|nr:MAG: hypothetical protein B7Y93_07020 [Micrococcales bacterium 32-70-13]